MPELHPVILHVDNSCPDRERIKAHLSNLGYQLVDIPLPPTTVTSTSIMMPAHLSDVAHERMVQVEIEARHRDKRGRFIHRHKGRQCRQGQRFKSKGDLHRVVIKRFRVWNKPLFTHRFLRRFQ